MKNSEFVKKINVSKTESEDWTYEISTESSTAKGEIQYADDFSDWEKRCPALRSRHPTIASLFLKTIKVKRIAGGIVDVKLEYEAAQTAWSEMPGKSAVEALDTYSTSISGGEEPILAHKLFCDIPNEERRALKAIMDGGLDEKDQKDEEAKIKSTSGILCLSKIKKNITSFEAGGLVYHRKTVIRSLTETRWSRTYKIDNPPGPATGSSNSWLYMGAETSPLADGTWEMTASWKYSPDGWDIDIYK